MTGSGSRIRRLPGVLEAALALSWARLRLLRRDGDQVLAELPEVEDHPPLLPSEHEAPVRNVSRALAAARRRLPWESTCLTQSLAAARMLRRRGIPGQLLIGVEQDVSGRLQAHAWVRAGDIIVCGGRRELPKVLAVHALRRDS